MNGRKWIGLNVCVGIDVQWGHDICVTEFDVGVAYSCGHRSRNQNDFAVMHYYRRMDFH